jgi:hypothetical protein
LRPDYFNALTPDILCPVVEVLPQKLNSAIYWHNPFIMIKKYLFSVTLALMIISNAFAQLPFSKDARSKRDFEKKREVSIENGFDIVPFPGEHAENIQRSVPGAQAFTNWGKELLLPSDLVERVKKECKFKVVVKVFDSGDSEHPFLKKGRLPAANYTTEQNAVDVAGHGTHVAGIIAAQDFGLVRPLIDFGLLSWKAVRVLNNNGSGDFQWVSSAITAEDIDNKTILKNGGFVICNGSFGGQSSKIPAVEDALKVSTGLGVVYFFAAGNTGSSGVIYPASSPYSIACAALDKNLDKANFSTTGPEVLVGEPGVDIKSTYLGNNFANLSGTSMATPFLTSVSAIALSKWGAVLANYQTMGKYLAWVAADILPAGKDDKTGYGISYVRAVLDKNPADIGAVTPPPPPPPVDPGPIVREERTLLYYFPDPQATIYYNFLPSSTEAVEKGIPKLFRATKVMQAETDLASIKITGVKVAVKSTTSADIEFDRLDKNLKWFFPGRGFGMKAGSDYADVIGWSAYFLEYYLETQRPDKQKVDVLEISGTNMKGKPVVFTYNELKHYPQLK